jgi:uncharacterized cupin superfamily protein
VANVFEPQWDEERADYRRARLGDALGSNHIGVSLYELQPGKTMVFHYHLGWEELLLVVRGRLTLRTFDGERELRDGDLVGFPRGERGAHGYENRSGEPVRLLVFSERTAPNMSVYPDAEEVGLFDAAHPAERRFGALFKLGDSVSGYGGGEPNIRSKPGRKDSRP